MDTELLLLILIGFFAQLVDGALGMAFGVISTSAMMALGMPPAQASALVHTAEVFTTGASGAWHVFHGNVDWRPTLRLGIAGVVGAVVGASLLSHFDAAAVRPYVSAYLLLVGVYIILKATGRVPAVVLRDGWHALVGFAAGMLDSTGGGWGPVMTSWLIGSGTAPRKAIGSVNTAEFFVTLAAATTFTVELGTSSLQQLVPLAIGGLFAAPFGGWVAKRMPAKALMFAVGLLIVGLALWQFAHGHKAI